MPSLPPCLVLVLHPASTVCSGLTGSDTDEQQ